jgi:hypothetical protein
MFDKRFMYEAAIHIPLLIRYPLEVAPSSVSDDFVVNIDFAETLLDYAGANPLPGAQGRSMRPILRGKAPPDWISELSYCYWMHRAHFDIPAHLGIRTKERLWRSPSVRSPGTGLAAADVRRGEPIFLEQSPDRLRGLFVCSLCRIGPTMIADSTCVRKTFEVPVKVWNKQRPSHPVFERIDPENGVLRKKETPLAFLLKGGVLDRCSRLRKIHLLTTFPD